MRFLLRAIFLLMLVGENSLHAADVKFIQVGKAAYYTQTGTGAPILLTDSPYEFKARVDLTRTQSVGSATLKWASPINTSRLLTNYGGYLEFSQRYALQDLLNFS